MKTGHIVLVFSLLLILSACNQHVSETNNETPQTGIANPASMGAPLPDGYMYNLCKKYNSDWVCNTTTVNNIDCCMCNNVNETFYFEVGCSDLSPQEICVAGGGNWTIDANSRPNLKKCVCPPEQSFSYAQGCFK